VKSQIRNAVIFLVAFFIFLIASIPAQWVVQQLPPQLSQQLQLTGVSGTLWRGEAASVVAGGENLGMLTWSLLPLPLLWGQASLDIELNSDKHFAEGELSIGLLDQSLTLQQTRLRVPVAGYAARFPLSGFTPQGVMELRLDQLVYSDAAITDLTGELQWSQAALSNDLMLGDLAADFQLLEGKLVAQLKDLGGALSLDGKFTLESSGAYTLKTILANTDPVNTALSQTLRLVGRPAANGTVPFNHSGRLPLPAALAFR